VKKTEPDLDRRHRRRASTARPAVGPAGAAAAGLTPPVYHYITVTPDATLTTRLPISPDTVFRYINGDQARYAGFELAGASGLRPYATISGAVSYVWAGVALIKGITARAGVENVTDELYATHLNALNPFTGQRINEIGRSFYAGLEWGF